MTPALELLSPSARRSSPTSPRGRWRLAAGVRVRQASPESHGDIWIGTGVRRWRLRGLEPPLASWLTMLGQVPAAESPAADAASPQASVLLAWLQREGLLVRQDPTRVLLLDEQHGHLPGLPGAVPHVDHRVLGAHGPLPHLPGRAELEQESGLVVVRARRIDRALVWLLTRSGLDHVLAEATAEECRIGVFAAGTACLLCDDLGMASQRPLLTTYPSLGRVSHARRDAPVPLWMADWVQAQVVVAWRQWSAGVQVEPHWWWLRADGSMGRRRVHPHPDCCGRSASAAA